MLLTNKYIHVEDADTIIVVYEYYGCLYSCNVLQNHLVWASALYTTLQEAFTEAVAYLHKYKYAEV